MMAQPPVLNLKAAFFLQVGGQKCLSLMSKCSNGRESEEEEDLGKICMFK